MGRFICNVVVKFLNASIALSKSFHQVDPLLFIANALLIFRNSILRIFLISLRMPLVLSNKSS